MSRILLFTDLNRLKMLRNLMYVAGLRKCTKGKVTDFEYGMLLDQKR